MATDCAVMPSTESMGRSTTESGAPAVPKGISTTGNCQICRSNPLSCDSRRTMASACRRRSKRSAVSALVHTRIPANGPIVRTRAITRFTPDMRLISSVACV